MGWPLTPFRGDKGLDKTKPFYVCDIEAYKWKKFRVMGHYDGKNFKHFRRLHDYFTFISSDAEDKQIFAHYGGVYDFNFLLDYLLLRDKEKRFRVGSLIPRGSGLLCFDVFYDHEENGETKEVKLSFNDSSALLSFGLKNLTTSFGVKHKKGNFDFEKWDGEVTFELLSYLKDDCRGLYEVIERYRNWPLVRRAGSATTMASQAMKIYRCFMRDEIYPLSNSADEFTRRAYFGGRTEIFKPYFDGGTKEKLKNFDVNSLYPYTMLQNEYPVGATGFTYKYDPESLGIYHVDVEVPNDMYIPVLGAVTLVPSIQVEIDKKGRRREFKNLSNKFIFPTGRFTGYWTTSELEYAKTLGVKILKVHRGLLFRNGGKIFERYINTLYDMRLKAKQDGDGVTDIICKLLMNSLYGRFGMNPNKENINIHIGGEVAGAWRVLKNDLGERVSLVKNNIELGSFSNCAISCFVTSNSRVLMHKHYSKLDNKIWYTDTDSLFTTKNIKTSDKLGALKLEYESKRACFILPKTYITETEKDGGELMKKITMKGFEKRKVQNFTIEDFQNSLEGEIGLLTAKNSEKFCRWKTAIRKGEFLSMMDEQQRTIRSKYDKRRIYKTSSGDYDTEPLHIEDGEVVN